MEHTLTTRLSTALLSIPPMHLLLSSKYIRTQIDLIHLKLGIMVTIGVFLFAIGPTNVQLLICILGIRSGKMRIM